MIRNLTIALFLLTSTAILAQKPIVRSLSKTSGASNDVISIKGNNFGTDSTKLSVFFGAVKGKHVTVTDQLLEVQVPAGTTYDYVSVENITTGLTGYSRDPFLLSFQGDHGIDINNLQGQSDFDAESGLYDLCMCDFDGDKRADVITANNTSNFASLLKNISTGPGNVNFSKTNLSVGKPTLHVKCGDLNGDGKPDIILSEGTTALSNEIYIFQNKSTGIGDFTFSAVTVLKLTGTLPVRIEIADLDLDGLPEVIFTDKFTDNTGAGQHRIGILSNQSTLSTVSISSTPQFFSVSDDATDAKITTEALAIGDLNNDGLPEIISSKFQTNQSNVFILLNKSNTPGTIDFAITAPLLIDRNVKRIKIGDLDGDAKPDIAVTRSLSPFDVTIFLNQSASTVLAFAAPKSFLTDSNPWGFDFGDLDGDGKTDIIVTSTTKTTLTILNNESTPGVLAFTSFLKPVTTVTRHISVGDVDTDGKPDIVFTSIDDATLGPFSKISVFRNKACIIPAVTPTGPLTICSGFPLKLFTNINRGITYDWKNNAASTGAPSKPSFDVTVTGLYTVTAVAEGGTCSKVSNAVTITVAGTGAAATTISPPIGPICSDGTFQPVTSNDGTSTYKWSGPNGYVGLGATALPKVTPFKAANAGRYTVEVFSSAGCLAQRASIVIDIVDIDDFIVSYSGADVICQGDKKKYSITPNNLAGFTYQWFEQTTGILTGEENVTYEATATGNYYAKASSVTCGDKETLPVMVTVATPPVPKFTMPASDCKGHNVQFTNTSDHQAGIDVFYSWNFGDLGTSTDVNPVHKYITANTWNVTLTASYKSSLCSVTSTPAQQIDIQTAPDLTIVNATATYSLCPGESLKLEVLGAFDSFVWSTGATESFINVTTGGIYKIEAKSGTCTLNDEQEVTALTTSIQISAEPALLNEGETSQLLASGLDTYTWSPADYLSSTSIENPIASPPSTITYTVAGKDSDSGCDGQATIKVTVKGEPIVNKLKPGNFFSPNNGDQKNDFWTIDNILEYPQCNVSVYDDKGIKVFESKPYNNDWDGTTLKGKRLPDGVYYYVIRCDGEESKPRTGSITLLR